MHWAEYSSSSNKAKVHLGFDLNHGIPRKIFLTEGKASERPFVTSLVDPGQTAVMDFVQGRITSPFVLFFARNCAFICTIKKG
jgi:hypothetical protein